VGADRAALAKGRPWQGTGGRPSRHQRDRACAQERSVEVEPPRETFETIVIDPPWPMTKIKREVRPNQGEFDYPTTSETELAFNPFGPLTMRGNPQNAGKGFGPKFTMLLLSS
jgi:hypothetical protein